MTEMWKNLDVLFVIPPVLRFLSRSSRHFPLGLGYMVSVLEKEGFNSEIYNADVHHSSSFKSAVERVVGFIKKTMFRSVSSNVDFARQWPMYHEVVSDPDHQIWAEVATVLRNARPRIVGISSRVVDIPSTLMLARLVKRELPDSLVIVGGPSATTCPEYLLDEAAVDLLVMGEGERTICEITRLVVDGKDPREAVVEGIAFRDTSGETIITAPRALVEDLDSLPFPNRNAMFIVERRDKKKYVHECKDVLSSRGCPYLCTFCCAYKAWGTRRARFRSVNNLIEEIEYLKREYGQRHFIFWDDLFTADRSRVVAVCNEIIRRRLNITWLCLVRLNTIDHELLHLMKAAGCRELQIGIESGNDRVLKFIKKGISRKMIFEKVPLLRESGIPWRIFLIIGFPTETKAEMDDTLRLIKEIKPTYLDLSLFCPYPGTDLHNDLERQGLLGRDFMKSDMWYPYNNYTGTMTDAEFQEYAFNALRLVDRYITGRC